MEEKTKNNFGNWIKNNPWVLAVCLGALVFIGLLFKLVNGHPVSYDAINWKFTSESRTTYGAEILFGKNSAVVWPLLIVYGLVIIATVLAAFTKLNKKCLTVSLVIFLVAGVMLLLSNYLFAYSNAVASARPIQEALADPDDYYWYIEQYLLEVESRLEAGTIVSAALCFAAGIVSFAGAFNEEKMAVREMAEMGMLIAVAIVLDVIFHLIPNVPGQAGSISIATLPLYLIALRHGPVKGFMASSFVYGIITCLTDGYGLWLYPLDYFVGFAGIAIIGLFKDQIFGENQTGYNFKGELFIFLSVMLSAVVRIVGSGASSILNYNYSFAAAFEANIIYVGVSALICAVIMMGLYGYLIKINKAFPVKKA